MKEFNHNNQIYKAEELKNFKELIEYSTKKYSNNVAYKFKINKKIIEKTYLEIKEEVEALGTALLNMGLENKKIALISPNRYEWCVSYLGITTSNIVVVPLDKALPELEIENLIKRSKVDAVIFSNKHKEIFENLRKKEEIKYYINMDLENDEENVISFKQLILKGKELIKNGDNNYKNIKIDNEKLSVLIFTSGTTSNPKGVMLSQKNIISNVIGMAKMSKMYAEDVILSFLPLHHTFECTITFLYGFYSGATVAFCDGLKYISQNLQEYKVSVFVAVPLILESIYKKIQKQIKEQNKEKMIKFLSKVTKFLLIFKIDIRRKVFKAILNSLGGNLRIAYFGAAAMDKNVIDGFNTFGIETVQGYGLTETAPLVSAETDKEHIPGSVGITPENIEVKLDDVNQEGIGEILVKGPNVMLGYYEDENATKDVLKDNWFYTGDLGYFDKKGYLYLTGRKKEVIVLKNGENVYPKDIEILINKLQYVKESMVFPRNNSKGEINLGIKIVYDEKIVEELFGEKSKEELESIIWKDVKDINQKLSHFKRIKELIITNEELEKTTTQKIKRFKEIEKIDKKVRASL